MDDGHFELHLKIKKLKLKKTEPLKAIENDFFLCRRRVSTHLCLLATVLIAWLLK